MAAVFSLVSGIIGACLWIIPIIGLLVALPAASVAIFLGANSVRRIHHEPLRWRGRGLAVAGLVLGCVGLIFAVYAAVTYWATFDSLQQFLRGNGSRQ